MTRHILKITRREACRFDSGPGRHRKFPQQFQVVLDNEVISGSRLLAREIFAVYRTAHRIAED